LDISTRPTAFNRTFERLKIVDVPPRRASTPGEGPAPLREILQSIHCIHCISSLMKTPTDGERD